MRVRVALVALLAAAAAGCGGGLPDEDEVFEEIVDRRVAELREAGDFTGYWLGRRFGEVPISSMQVRLDRDTRDRGSLVEYGACNQGCETVAAVQTTDDPRAREVVYEGVRLVERRGVPAVVGRGEKREALGVLYTADHTIYLRARDDRTLERVIAAVQPVAGRRVGDLPAPVGDVPGR